MKQLIPTILGLCFMCSPIGALADDKAAPEPPKISINSNATVSNILQALKGKKLEIYLRSGKTVSGTLKEVSTHTLQLEKISNKSYYDAFLRLEDISGFDIQMRFPRGSY